MVSAACPVGVVPGVWCCLPLAACFVAAGRWFFAGVLVGMVQMAATIAGCQVVAARYCRDGVGCLPGWFVPGVWFCLPVVVCCVAAGCGSLPVWWSVWFRWLPPLRAVGSWPLDIAVMVSVACPAGVVPGVWWLFFSRCEKKKLKNFLLFLLFCCFLGLSYCKLKYCVVVKIVVFCCFLLFFLLWNRHEKIYIAGFQCFV